MDQCANRSYESALFGQILFPATLVALIVSGCWWAIDSIHQVKTYAGDISDDIAENGLPTAERALGKSGIEDVCGGDPSCETAALLAHMLIAERKVTGEPDAPTSIGNLNLEPRTSVHRRTNSPRKTVPVPYIVDIKVDVPEVGSVDIGELTLFKGDLFSFEANWRLNNGSEWPRNSTSLAQAVLKRVQSAYEDYRDAFNSRQRRQQNAKNVMADKVVHAISSSNEPSE